ncbi:hypothetical protein P3X46_014144 [Hevea brasiliensis]|uniref:Uncharacterized protein n=1 Tax=Hevea brasiliensis TaxID=3981 RepID=A0ABQ9M7H2_HEVBR|nr:hypothetical protein P3X46_014144 [Hevea brasiliensis]
MKRASFLLIIISILTTTIPAHLAIGNEPTTSTFQESQKNCSYSIEIETTLAPSAGTKDHIMKPLKNPKLLYGPKGFRKQGGSYGGFGRCSIDMFEANGPCMKQSVCSLYLKKVGSDDWRPGWVKVLHQEGNGHLVPVSYTFYFRIFVPGNAWYGFDYCHTKEGFKPQVASFGTD